MSGFLKAIREKCLDCSGGIKKEVRACPVLGCALHPYRMGKNSGKKRRFCSERQLKALQQANEQRAAKRRINADDRNIAIIAFREDI